MRLKMKNKTSTLRALFRNTLKGCYKTIEVVNFSTQETIEEEETNLSVDFRIHSFGDFSDDTVHSFKSQGKGFVDAAFNGFLTYVQDNLKIVDFPKTFRPRIAKFSIGATGHGRKNNAEGPARCSLEIYSKNAVLDPFFFESEEFSINAASLKVVVEAVEFFINAQASFSIVQNALQDAKKRHRIDLVESNTRKLIEIVSVSDYSLLPKNIL